MKTISISPEWKAAAETISKESGISLVVATRKMADKAVHSGAEVIIVNTSGLVLDKKSTLGAL